MTDDRIIELVEPFADDCMMMDHKGEVIAYARVAIREALEEAATVCEQMVSVSAISYETGSACAAAIRALTQKTAQGEAK